MTQTGSALPGLPEKAPHFFTEVAFPALQELNIQELVYLSQIVKARHREQKYLALRDVLRKIQWAKLAALEATGIEKEIAAQMEPGIVTFDPIGQARHAKAVMECVTHCKAALDSLAVFLAALLALPDKGGQCDLRRHRFREKIEHADPTIGAAIRSAERWITDLVARRDVWIHWSSPMIALVVGPSEVGVLPVPKKLAEYPGLRDAITKDNYWSTQEFVELNVTALIQLFRPVVQRCIDIELTGLPKPRPFPPESTNASALSFFPMTATQDMQITAIRFRA